MIIFQNDILIGKPFENKLDDPVLDISVDPDECDPRPEQMKCDIGFYLEKAANIFVDEFTTPLPTIWMTSSGMPIPRKPSALRSWDC